MKLHFGRPQLEKAFRAHRKVGNSHAPCNSGVLLLCYAAECGLKRVLLTARNVHTTEKLDDDDLTHDLDMLQKKVGCNVFLGRWRVNHSTHKNTNTSDLHQVFRYGGTMQAIDMHTLQTKLQEITSWIDENI